MTRSLDILLFRLRRLSGVLLTVLLVGCTTDPATGQMGFGPFLSQEDEASLGAQEHPKILEQYGGVYDEREIGAYVAMTGGRMAPHTGTNTRFTFTVLDSDVVNAFALPGGYVYVTRGLLALANSEAELAGVVGHEMGHVAGRHSAQRQTRGTIIGLGSAILGAVIGSPIVGDLAGQGAQLYLLRYSRDQEYQADDLGLRYTAHAGYDPYALPRFLEAMEAQSRLESRLAGKGEGDPPEFFSTHPNTEGRVERAVEQARRTGVAQGQGTDGRDAFLRQIDGMVYGDSPAQGFVRGRTFSHPEYKLTFTVPEGFQIRNTSEAVMARGPAGTAILFDADRLPRGLDIQSYLTRSWGEGAALRDVETFDLNGMPAATGLARASTRGGSRIVRLIAIGFGPTQVFRFMIALPTDANQALLTDLRRMTYSFRRLSDAEAAKLKPTRLRIVTVKPGDTVESLAGRMALRDFPEERFRVLNGLRAGAALRPGMKVKIVAE